MQKLPQVFPTKFIVLTLLLVGATTACNHASADNLPIILSFSENLSRDSNLFRVAPDQYSIADTVSSTGLRLGIDKSYGRQKYTTNFGIYQNIYFDEEKLNNLSYDFNVGLSSEFLDKGYFQISAKSNQNLARFDVANSNTVYSLKNTQSNNQIYSQISYGGYGALTPYFTAQHYQQGFTYTSSNYQAMNQNTYGVGLNYALVPQLTVGFGGRYTGGDIDYDRGDGITLINKINRRDIDFTSNWVATGLSSFYARLSLSREKDAYTNSTLLEASTRGLTGELNWKYTPQGRLSYSINFTRESGNAGRGYDISNTAFGDSGYTYAEAGGSALENRENNRLRNTLNTQIEWDASNKIKINAAYSYTRYLVRQSYDTTVYSSDGSLLVPGDPIAKENSRYTELSLGGKYFYARWFDIYCEIKRIKRTRDVDYSPFNATVTSCNGQFNINGMN